MRKHEEVTIRPEERLQRAARIFAMGAIRAALGKQASLAGNETSGEGGTEPRARRRQRPAGAPERG
jgi:hypothetical protein